MIPIVTPEEMAAIDAAAPEPVETLIARAGWAVARQARIMLGGTYGRRVVVIAGKGNNGADGRVAGELLARRGVQVTVVDPWGRAPTAAGRAGGEDPHRTPRPVLPAADLIVDAAFGTGLRRDYRAPVPADAATPVLAVDIPSGVSGLTGRILGEPLAADHTVTFAALKPGLVCGPGRDLAGQISTVDIGLDVGGARAHLVTAADVAAWLPRRSPHTHKWRAAVRLVAGSPGMTGSADLATAAALRTGAGYVRRSSPGVDPARPGTAVTGPVEAVTTALPARGWAEVVARDLQRFGVLAIGPGLGRDAAVAAEVRALVDVPVPVVIDGDGLGALGGDPAEVLGARQPSRPPVVLTPHDGEFVALGGRTGADTDRFAQVRELAAATGAVVLHKGSPTVVAEPGGRILVVDVGDARLATAGTGDVLTGTIAALTACGLDPFPAAATGAWLHGRAAHDGPDTGLVASDLPGLIAALMDRMGNNGPVRDLSGDPPR